MFKRILILAPHTDDGELGCGGTIAKFVSEGREVYQAAFSTAARSLPAGFPSDTLCREFQAASSVLGIPTGNLIIHNYPVREFPSYRQEILEKILSLRRELQPELVILPALEDIHQDHNTVAMEGVRAFKQVSVFGYELPWNNLATNNTGFVSLTEENIDRKVKAMSCYISQKNRPYCQGDVIVGLARARGVQVGAKYAEMFSVIRLVVG